ncbi:MAG TPA: carboxymuconolactone decarboxylase family protein [Dietzia timorensis]|uniref:Carboxymuconolactone decarboxylase family protein n=1 Tax=Dietzia timorensis TaxID=499555 RepID=A0A921F7Y3_9ACTN|nr:carboxymuconolactone decarboxylase family protein [Dietzia timorensis]HJE92078.1 carboxymuconolactone decarboxylase family protein [Dietzia timorensis]
MNKVRMECDATDRAWIPLGANSRFERFAEWASTKIYGKVLDPLAVSFHHKGALASSLALEATASRWKALPTTLSTLAILAVGREIGCSWCMDFGYWEAHHRGVPVEKIRSIAGWETSAVYSPPERKVIAYAVAATATPSAVTREMVEELREELTDRQIVELAALVSLENYRSRTNAGLGLSSQGFEDTCEIG